MTTKTIIAKPVLKWAGGKSQLLEQISRFLPAELTSGEITRYAEPFIGGGAVFFYIAQNFRIEKFYISDLNHELIVLYTSIQRQAEHLIELLRGIQATYHSLSSDKQKTFFYDRRADFNHKHTEFDFDRYSHSWVERASQIIFLNRTCFNGLFRVNSKGKFNVPFGDYKNPRICDADNLRAVSNLLKRAEIKAADFTGCEKFINGKTFVYFDPPYRPISKTASFTAYSIFDFGDDEQMRLADFYRKVDTTGAKLMLSNSDPKNQNPQDDFFENIYSGFNINRVFASRNINSKASGRGQIYELLITNY